MLYRGGLLQVLYRSNSYHMQVILLTDVPKVGRKHQVKNVSDGYANNFLFPRKLAERATAAKVKAFETLSVQAQEHQNIEQNLLKMNLAALKSAHVHISARANEQGHLYEGLREPEILAALREQLHIELPEGALKLKAPLKAVGEHTVSIEVEGEKGSLKVVVAALA